MPATKQTPKKPAKTPYVSCEECGAPLDEKQRYCVSCGTRRRDKSGPAVEYLAGAGRRSRRGTGRAVGSSGARAAAVLFFIVLPIAVAIGVLVGQGNGSNNDQELADAIKNLQTSGGAGTQLASTAAAPIASDFTLDQGYTVELKTLPSDSDQAAVDAAKKDATSKGATDVGIINPTDFTVTPAPQGGGLVLYSGQFKSRDEANKQLAKLKSKFLGAVVVQVKRASSAGGQGKLVGKSNYGDVHQVSGFQADAQKVASDTALVQNEGQKTGKDYVDSQKSLPDVIVVGGSGSGSSNPSAQGNGD